MDMRKGIPHKYVILQTIAVLQFQFYKFVLLHETAYNHIIAFASANCLIAI